MSLGTIFKSTIILFLYITSCIALPNITHNESEIKNAQTTGIIYTENEKDIESSVRLQNLAISPSIDTITYSLIKAYEDFSLINPESIEYFKNIVELNKLKIPYQEVNRLQEITETLDEVSKLFYKIATHSDYFESTTDHAIRRMFDSYQSIMKNANLTKTSDISDTIRDFSFSLNLDDMLFAHPISTRAQIFQTNLNINAIKYMDVNPTGLPSHDTISDDDYIQSFMVYDADQRSLFEAHIAIKNEDIQKNEFIREWGIEKILTTRFNNLSNGKKYITAYWILEFNENDLYASKLVNDKNALNTLYGKNIYYTKNQLSGVFYGGSAAKKLINSYNFRLTFDSSLPVIKQNKSGKICVNNIPKYTHLTNNRTRKSSTASFNTKHCINARPGDTISFYSYYWFKPKEPTLTLLVINPLNESNKFESNMVLPIYLGNTISSKH